MTKTAVKKLSQAITGTQTRDGGIINGAWTDQFKQVWIGVTYSTPGQPVRKTAVHG